MVEVVLAARLSMNKGSVHSEDVSSPDSAVKRLLKHVPLKAF